MTKREIAFNFFIDNMLRELDEILKDLNNENDTNSNTTPSFFDDVRANVYRGFNNSNI